MKQIPEPTRKRLLLLAQLLTQQHTEKITSVNIENLTGWSQSLIRRDISLLDCSGVSNGYNVADLRKAICEALNITVASEQKHCCIVGLGRLGAALLENSFFEHSPFKIVAGFDASVNRTEVLRSTFPLYPSRELESVIPREHIEYAILAVPDASAQETAVRLVRCGIKGIANYTGTVLSVDEGVAVENAAPVTILTSLLAKSNLSL
ncbi:MAG: redox-sensing transcriptional repressor Rex [Treponema sp.]|nr:redox-sensing transcriptional repressor Rex [Treponema sp.]